MNLNDMLNKPLEKILEDCNVLSIKPISDDEGNILKLIIEYAPCDMN